MKTVSRRSLLLASSAHLIAAGCARARSTEPAIPSRPSSASEEPFPDPPPERDDRDSRNEWIHTWVSAQQLVEPGNHPPEPGLERSSLRQRLLLTLGGSSLRFRLSNEYGKAPLEIIAAHVALPENGATIHETSGRAITFSGQTKISVGPGETALSDSVTFVVEPQTELAVTLRFGSVPPDLTGHPGSRTTSFLAREPAVDATRFDGAQTTDHWYVLAGVEVNTNPKARAIVILGDSITDGRGSTTNRNDRYPNILARRLLENESTRHLAVLNQGIGGNRVLTGGLGPCLLERYRRDAIEIEKARYVVIFAGINDLGALDGGSETPPPSASRLVEAFRTIARAAHDRGQLVYGVTLLPYEGSFYFTQQGESERQKFNEFLRTTKDLDACIDFDEVTRDPAAPSRLRSEVDGGDHLHPSARGYEIMGQAISLGLFSSSSE